MSKVLLSLGLALALGCGGQSPPHDTTTAPTGQTAVQQGPDVVYGFVTLTAVPYFASGPMQDRPPDGEIPAGVPCRVLDGSIGPYAEIETGDGTHGWVAADALGPNPPP